MDLDISDFHRLFVFNVIQLLEQRYSWYTWTAREGLLNF